MGPEQKINGAEPEESSKIHNLISSSVYEKKKIGSRIWGGRRSNLERVPFHWSWHLILPSGPDHHMSGSQLLHRPRTRTDASTARRAWCSRTGDTWDPTGPREWREAEILQEDDSPESGASSWITARLGLGERRGCSSCSSYSSSAALNLNLYRYNSCTVSVNRDNP